MEPQDVNEVIGSDAYDPDGVRVGRVGQVFLDDKDDEPTWVTVDTGGSGAGESFVPLDGASFDGDRLVVAYPKDRIASAPHVGDQDHLTPAEEERLHDHYGTTVTATGPDTGPATGPDATATDPSAVGAPSDDAMTLSEERLQVGTSSRVSGRARMRKHVVVEEVQVTVPVRREKVVLETDAGESPQAADVPVDAQAGADAPAGSGSSGDATGQVPGEPLPGDGQPDEAEMIVYEERPVVTTETVPVQRVKLATTEDVVDETVTEDLRRERVDLDGDSGEDTGGPTSR